MKIKYKIVDFDPILRIGDWVEITGSSGIYKWNEKRVVGKCFKLPEDNDSYINMKEFYSKGETEVNPGKEYSINVYKKDLRKLTRQEIKDRNL